MCLVFLLDCEYLMGCSFLGAICSNVLYRCVDSYQGCSSVGLSAAPFTHRTNWHGGDNDIRNQRVSPGLQGLHGGGGVSAVPRPGLHRLHLFLVQLYPARDRVLGWTALRLLHPRLLQVPDGPAPDFKLILVDTERARRVDPFFLHILGGCQISHSLPPSPTHICAPFHEVWLASLPRPTLACGTTNGARSTISPGGGKRTGRAFPRDLTTGMT